MNIPYNETPLFQAGDKIIEGVFKLGEDKEALIGMIEETLSVEQVFKLRELCFCSGSFNSLCLISQPLEFCHLFADLLGIAAERYCFKDIFRRLRSVSSISSISSGVGRSSGTNCIRSCARFRPSSRRLTLFSRECRMAYVLDASRL